MALSQSDRIASVTTPLGETDLLLYRMTGTEHLSQLFEYELELLSEKSDIDLKALLGKSTTVKLFLPDGKHRSFHGVVTRISLYGMLGRLYYYRATLRPKPWLLSRTSNCRIFSELSVPDIVKKLLAEHGYTDLENKLASSYNTREYCVQYRESDFNFISRLMEAEGIYYYFKHTDSQHTMVLCDDGSGHAQPPKQKIRYLPPENQGRRKEEHIFEWRVSEEIQSGAYEHDDFDFEKPKAELKATSNDPGGHEEDSKEVYDYPGNYIETADGDHYAKVRMQEMRAGFEYMSASGNTRSLAAGNKFDLIEFPRKDQNQEYIAVSTQVQLQNNGYESYGIADCLEPYQCLYTVISSKFNYRAPRISRIPIVQGVQTAIVVGKSGDEITTDKYGRVKVQFHWDREGKNDENSSCWVRVAQVWAGKNWGAIHIPRIGQEVIVDFLEGNPDRPIVTGRVYNADQMPPYDLDANKTQSGIKSRSSKDGSSDNFNEIRFEDKKGEEELYMHAEKNFTRVVENDDVHTIGFDKKDPGDQKVDIYNDRTVTLDQGNDLLTVKMGNRTAEIKQGNDEITVGMGNRTVKVDTGKITEEAMQSIELKVGQNSVKIDQTGVTIKGLMIKIEGQTTTDLKGLTTTVSGDAMLTVKGGVVMIN
ncbi:type VI secretion system Vgr family protein [Methylomonas methanica]|uniref:Type VI secretion system Vgr family protein n=1 Tax=Methylomonas methanica (strain DSM 25384 / MC09) TaxID=857087 RepID=F9ZYK8_METMM|nr:type VI secretion system tip protein VgrG [Methylomonas methanica]AEG02280.1 type VI secretion system Vgr family protein [Methylomonas methanica MC09]